MPQFQAAIEGHAHHRGGGGGLWKMPIHCKCCHVTIASPINRNYTAWWYCRENLPDQGGDTHQVRVSTPRFRLTSSKHSQLMPAAGASFIILGTTPCMKHPSTRMSTSCGCHPAVHQLVLALEDVDLQQSLWNKHYTVAHASCTCQTDWAGTHCVVSYSLFTVASK